MKPGDTAPDFETTDTNGNTVKLSDFKGKKVILYFYPKDDTPGCTIEACEFRDNFTQFKNAVILGVSPDNEESHQKFTKKFSLPFKLLCDTDKKICNAYGVYGPKMLYGKEVMGIHRTTFIIDEEGTIAHLFEKVQPKGHAQEILEKVK